jgi:hypothetical protein
LAQLDVCVQLERFWISNPAQSPEQSEKESKIQAFTLFLTASANNAFQGGEFQGDQSVMSCCKAPWRGCFPRNPLLSTIGLEVVRNDNAGPVNHLASAPSIFGENPDAMVYRPEPVQVQIGPQEDIERNIKNRCVDRIENENAFRFTEPKFSGSESADFLFKHPGGIPSAPTLAEIQEGANQSSAAEIEIYRA